MVRNERYRKNAISVRERHNERKNEVYSNPDVLLEYSHNNVTFKACEAATYAQQFDRMVEDGVVSTRGLKPDAYVFDEMVFDVNTDYFESHGGYEYAKKFYAEVYELAKEIAGGEQYIISAVMHADERNREASDRLGRDVFHYHLHVVYLPVVEMPCCAAIIYAFLGFIVAQTNPYLIPSACAILCISRDLPNIIMPCAYQPFFAVLCFGGWSVASGIYAYHGLSEK